MPPPITQHLRYIILSIIILFILLHFIFTSTSDTYASHVPSLSSAKEKLSAWSGSGSGGSGNSDVWYGGRRGGTENGAGKTNEEGGKKEKVNATFVTLARNRDLWELLDSMRGIEDRFNSRLGLHYDWVMLNDEPFTDEFKRHTSGIASGTVHYGLIPEEQWGKQPFPPGINATLANEKIQAMGKLPIPYGNSVPYRKMCRYQSGFFFEHELLHKYEYYWRVEPNVKFFCNLDYDPFRLMRDKKTKYGFVVSLYEYRETVESLWKYTKEWMAKFPQYVAKPNLLNWISNNNGETYNLCHFWSNFEICSLSFLRSEAYRSYFKHLDDSGGFFYERFGDAPVHSVAAALMLKPEEIHYFADIGYRHEPFQHCPVASLQNQCNCDVKKEENFEFHGYSCTPKWKVSPVPISSEVDAST
ncbi:glycosyltransferase family 15 protein [Sporobolomyces salmoneus]|uniref:glycosyltransferase family 15 protein n=1 Tax=Sporobolomyces salmoneus TaxID=183962 RepID=UPI00316CCCE7